VSWDIHLEWARKLGLNTEISAKVDEIIDESYVCENCKLVFLPKRAKELNFKCSECGSKLEKQHDVVKAMLRRKWTREALEQLLLGNVGGFFEIYHTYYWYIKYRKYKNLEAAFNVLLSIYMNFGEEGIRAAILHMFLDHMEQLHLENRSRDEVREKLGKKFDMLLYLAKIKTKPISRRY